MTIASEVLPRINYTGDGSQATYPYPWQVLAASDLAIYQNEVLKTLGVHYTLSSVGAPTGGNVVFLLAPGSGDDLVFVRDTEVTQSTTLSDTGPASMTAIERMVDRVTMICQEIKGSLGRVPLLSIFSPTQNPTFADPAALKAIRWNATANGLENWDPTTVLPASATLPLALILGGTGVATAAAARGVFGLDGQMRKVLANLTGITLAPGDVVAWDTATDSTVILGDTVASKAQLVVALETIPNTASGEFLLSGIAPVNVTGTITRGRYLRKSATQAQAEDSGTLHGAATDPPQGAFAVALTGGLAQVTARVFGFTFPGAAATPTITGLPGVKGLTAANNTGTPDTQYDVAAISAIVRDPGGGGTLVLPTVATRTLNIAVAGPTAGGRDQVVAFSANTWIYVFLIAKTDGTYHVTASLSATTPTLPSGYTLWAPLGALRINNSSALVRSRIRGARAWYDGKQSALVDGVATAETAVNLSSLIPPNALNATLFVKFYADTSTYKFHLRLTAGVEWLDSSVGGTSTADLPTQLTLPNIGQQFFYQWTAAPPATLGLYADVVGYENPI